MRRGDAGIMIPALKKAPRYRYDSIPRTHVRAKKARMENYVEPTAEQKRAARNKRKAAK